MSPDSVHSRVDHPGPTHEAFLRRVRSIPRLGAEEEQALAVAMREGEPRARGQLIEAHLPLVTSIAGRYQGRGLEFEDLVQEGTIGLIRGVEKFDPERGVRLATYAAWWIKAAIGRAVLERGRAVRLPSSAAAKLQNLERARAALRAQLGCEPSTDAVADTVGVPVSTVVVLQRAVQPPLRLDAQTAEDGESLHGLVTDPGEDPSPQDIFRLLAPILDRALGQLQDARQRDILRRHYGLDHRDTETVRQIGAHLGLSGARVAQLESAALATLASLPALEECRDALVV